MRVRTYGDLLTSIVHPNESSSRTLPLRQREKMAKSPMPEVNDAMTVRQLFDLVAFIQPRYTRLEPLNEMNYPTRPKRLPAGRRRLAAPGIPWP